MNPLGHVAQGDHQHQRRGRAGSEPSVWTRRRSGRMCDVATTTTSEALCNASATALDQSDAGATIANMTTTSVSTNTAP